MLSTSFIVNEALWENGANSYNQYVKQAPQGAMLEVCSAIAVSPLKAFTSTHKSMYQHHQV